MSIARPIALPAAILSTAALIIATGCGRVQPAAQAGSGPPPYITLDEARRVFADYERVNKLANTRFDPALMAGAETEPLVSASKAYFTVAKYFKRKPILTTYRNQRFFVPRTTAQVQPWFAVYATSEREGETFQHNFVFARQGEAWKATLTAELVDKAQMPQIAVDKDGYATALAATTPGLEIRPGDAAQLHSKYGFSGKPEPWLSKGYWTSKQPKLTNELLSIFRKFDWTAKATPEVVPTPTYALRTADGGAVVWYAAKQTIDADKEERFRSNGRVWRSMDIKFTAGDHDPVSDDREALSGGKYFDEGMDLVTTYQFAAEIPTSARVAMTVFAGLEQLMAVTADPLDS